MKRFWSLVMVMVVILTAVALAVNPVGAQEETPVEVEVPSDVVVIPQVVMILVALAAMVMLAGVFLVMLRVLEALKESYPPETVEVIGKAVGEGGARLFEQIKTRAPGTPTPLDDNLVLVLEPFVDMIVSRLRDVQPLTGGAQTMASISAVATEIPPKQTESHRFTFQGPAEHHHPVARVERQYHIEFTVEEET